MLSINEKVINAPTYRGQPLIKAEREFWDSLQAAAEKNYVRGRVGYPADNRKGGRKPKKGFFK